MTPIETLTKRAREARGTRVDVISPCIAVCRIGTVVPLCEGCFRTLSEIANWSRMSDDGKRVVWSLIESRMAAANP